MIWSGSKRLLRSLHSPVERSRGQPGTGVGEDLFEESVCAQCSRCARISRGVGAWPALLSLEVPIKGLWFGLVACPRAGRKVR